MNWLRHDDYLLEKWTNIKPPESFNRKYCLNSLRYNKINGHTNSYMYNAVIYVGMDLYSHIKERLFSFYLNWSFITYHWTVVNQYLFEHDKVCHQKFTFYLVILGLKIKQTRNLTVIKIFEAELYRVIYSVFAMKYILYS